MTPRWSSSLRVLLTILFFHAAASTAFTQDRTEAPVERCAFIRLTRYDSLQAFVTSLDGRGPITVQRIATSRQGRSVFACLISSSKQFGDDTTKLRVMLFAQQHGDEPAGKEALTLLLARAASNDLREILSHVDLIVVPQMNPDGAELRQRRTSDSIDLNRNHLLLTSPETKGLHDLFGRWWPHVTLDLHEFGAFSRSWSDSGFIKIVDVQLGMLTNLNSSEALRTYQRRLVFPFIAALMKKDGYLFHEYIVGSPGDRIRYSTTEINDGRQSFGILNTLSFIQEGRGGKELEERLERRARSQLASVKALLAYCAGHANEVRKLVNYERARLLDRAGRNVVVAMDHFPGGGEMHIPVHLVPLEKDSVWRVRPLHDVVRPLFSTNLPSSYVVPGEYASIIQLLKRHNVREELVQVERTVSADVYTIDTVRADTLEEEWHPRPALRLETTSATLHPGDVIVPTEQYHSLFLAILLEPNSMWGLVKYPGYEFLLSRKTYPILRIP
jgi:hypothetical protein